MTQHLELTDEFFDGTARSITAVTDKACVIKVCYRGQFDAARSVQAVVNSANAIGLDHATLRHWKLVRLKHADFTKFLLNHVSERLQIDTDGEANHHGVCLTSPYRGDVRGTRVDQSRVNSGRVHRGDRA